MLHEQIQIVYGGYTGIEKLCRPQKHIWLDYVEVQKVKNK
jgi:hypothetical protein